MEIEIREIEERDYQAVTALLVNYLWENHFNGDYVVPFFDKVKNDENYKTFVALFDDEVVGVVGTVTTVWAVFEAAHMMIQGFVVKSGFHNKGIGKKLLQHTEDYAKSKGVYGIGLCSGLQRTPAHIFYEKNGYSKGTQYFMKNFQTP